MHSLQTKPSPIIPWEVIEAIIDQCSDETTLRHLALTCSQLHPRSRLALLDNVIPRGLDRLSQFYNTVQENPHLRSLVRSVYVPWGKNITVSLLSLLPRLLHLTFSQAIEMEWQEKFPFSELRSLPCATSIRSLTINWISMESSATLHQFITLFPNLEHLTCQRMVYQRDSPLPKGARVHLRTLNMMETYGEKDLFQIAQLLHTNGEAVQKHRNYQTSITWSLPLEDWQRQLLGAPNIFRHLDHRAISGITIILRTITVSMLYHQCRYAAQNEQFTQLNELLRPFSNVNISLTTYAGVALNPRKTISWVDEVNKFLPSGNIFRLTRVSSTGVPGHDDTVTALIVSPDGRWVATASEDRTIILWDAKVACISQEWFAHKGHVTGLAFSPDSRHLASIGADHKLAIWDITGSVHSIACFSAPHLANCMWSADGAFIVCRSTSRILVCNAHNFKLLSSPDLAGCFSNDIQMSTDGHILMAYDESHLRIWEVQSSPFRVRTLLSLAETSFKRTLSPCGKYVAASYANKPICIRRITGDEPPVVLQNGWSHLYRFAFSPDSLFLMVLHWPDIHIWDARTGALVHTLRGHKNESLKVCFSPCGRYLASASRDAADKWSSSDSAVKLWNVRDGSCVATLPYHRTWVEQLAFTPDGTMLWTAAGNDTVLCRRVQDIIPDYCCVE